MALCTWQREPPGTLTGSKSTSIISDRLLTLCFLYWDFTLSDGLCCRGNRAKMRCTNAHGVIYPVISKGGDCNAYSRWVESAKVTGDDTALREWISKVSRPGPGAEPLALVPLQPGNKSQVLETYVLQKPSLTSTPCWSGNPAVEQNATVA